MPAQKSARRSQNTPPNELHYSNPEGNLETVTHTNLCAEQPQDRTVITSSSVPISIYPGSILPKRDLS